MSKTQLIVTAFCLWIEGWIIMLVATPIMWCIFHPYEVAVKHWEDRASYELYKKANK